MSAVLFRLKVEGLENVPKKTNFIIVANHTSYLDAGLIMAAVPHKIHCIAMRFLFRVKWLRLFLRLVEAFPVGSSSKLAQRLILENKNLGLFPEGGVSPDGSLREFRRGVALLAYKTGRPIVPCAILGAYEALPLHRRAIRLRPIRVRIGKPVYLLKEFEEVLEDVLLQEGIFRVRTAIQELLDGAGKDV